MANEQTHNNNDQSDTAPENIIDKITDSIEAAEVETIATNASPLDVLDALREEAAAAAEEIEHLQPSSPYVEPIENEYEFDEEPEEAPKPMEARPTRPVSPVVAYHNKTRRNSLMLVIAGVVCVGAGSYLLINGPASFINTAIAVFFAGLGIAAVAVGLSSYTKTDKLLKKARREFAQDRAMRIYLACYEAGIEDSETDDEKSRILNIAMKHGFDLRNEAVGLYNAGRKLTAAGKTPNPDFDDVK